MEHIAETRPLLDAYMTKREFADEVEKTERTIDNWDRYGKGPRRVKLGNMVLYPRSEVQTWLLNGGTVS